MENENPVMIEVVDLQKYFGKLHVLKGINPYKILKREVVSIMGPSGGGKSTFLRCINRLETNLGESIY